MGYCDRHYITPRLACRFICVFRCEWKSALFTTQRTRGKNDTAKVNMRYCRKSADETILDAEEGQATSLSSVVVVTGKILHHKLIVSNLKRG